MKQTLIYTATGVQNLWDECILASEILELLATKEGDIVVATYDQKDTESALRCIFAACGKNSAEIRDYFTGRIRFISYFPNGFRERPFQNIRYFFRNCWEIIRSELIVIGWGGIFYDTEAGQSFPKQILEWSIRLFIAKVFRKPLFFWSIWIDVTPENFSKIRWWFAGGNTRITVRESYSQSIFLNNSLQAEILEDSVFRLPLQISLSDTISTGTRVLEEFTEEYRWKSPAWTLKQSIPYIDSKQSHYTRQDWQQNARIWIALRTGYVENEREMIVFMVKTIRKYGYEPIFMSHSLHASNILCNDCRSFLEIATELQVHITSSIEETFSFYPTLSGIIGMRLHANILAHQFGIPSFALSYGKKTEYILQPINSPYFPVKKGCSFEYFKELETFLSSKIQKSRGSS